MWARNVSASSADISQRGITVAGIRPTYTIQNSGFPHLGDPVPGDAAGLRAAAHHDVVVGDVVGALDGIVPERRRARDRTHGGYSIDSTPATTSAVHSGEIRSPHPNPRETTRPMTPTAVRTAPM